MNIFGGKRNIWLQSCEAKKCPGSQKKIECDNLWDSKILDCGISCEKCRKAEQAACKYQTKGHTRGGDAPTVLPIERTHRGGTQPQCNPTNGHTYFHRGGDAPTIYPNERTHIFSQGGGRTHNVTQRTDTPIFFETLTDGQSQILRQHAA